MGPFPALLVLPGAGNIPRPAPVEHARHGYAALDIQVYGNPVDAGHYDLALDEKGLTQISQFPHLAIYLHALQAARTLKLLPGVDSGRMAVLGGSQGGRLSLITAAFDPSFKAVVAAIPHYGYLPWRRWVDEQNEAKSNGGDGFAASAHQPGSPAAQGYLDILNFAPLVRCPVLMNAGLADPTSPPTTIFAVYDRLAGPKKLIPLPNCGHDWRPAFDRYAWRWLDDILTRSSVSRTP
jgi:cephalosporin-C deacetylase-like acetyl esterase